MDQRNGQAAVGNGASSPKITLEDVRVDEAEVWETSTGLESLQEPRRKDDLRRLQGIGPKVQDVLHAAGVLTFSQLGRASQKKLKTLLEAAGYGHMNPSTWPEQAKLAAKGDWDGLAQFKSELKGRRRG